MPHNPRVTVAEEGRTLLLDGHEVARKAYPVWSFFPTGPVAKLERLAIWDCIQFAPIRCDAEQLAASIEAALVGL